MKKIIYIASLLVLIGTMTISCNKEKNCACEYEYQYADDPNTYTIKREIKIDKGSCEDIDGLVDDNVIRDSTTRYHELSCRDIDDD